MPKHTERLHMACGLPWDEHEWQRGKGGKSKPVCPDEPTVPDFDPYRERERPTGRPFDDSGREDDDA